MSGTIFPLVYKPGINRDGTEFQFTFCGAGQWMRFQRGKARKIGGMTGILPPDIIPGTFVSNILILPTPNNNNIYVYLGSTTGIYSYILSQDFSLVETRGNVTGTLFQVQLLWQSAVIILPVSQPDGTVTQEKRIIFMGTNNASNISDESAPIFRVGNAYSTDQLAQDALIGNSPKANGGMCYSAPFLFIYGVDGIVQYSKTNNPLDFTITPDEPTSGGELNIAPDTGAKVIYGRPIRGGANSPSLLFWTTSSVVRVTNVGDTTISFKTDILSSSTSLMSSRSIVEYDGTFFWIGTDRFFIFNGIVQELPNTLNFNYFFDNVNMDQRQKIFGVKNTRYGEIWWFYPTKGATSNTRAIIYNKRENSWYDTAISRDCGVFAELFGMMITYGKSLVDPSTIIKHLFQHETTQTNADNAITVPSSSEILKTGGDIRVLPIPSSISTPKFSWAAFNPMQQATGVNRWMNIRRIEPDFLLYNFQADPTIQITFLAREYPDSPPNTWITQTLQYSSNTPKLDFRIQGRYIDMRIESDSWFEIGHILILADIGDAQ